MTDKIIICDESTIIDRDIQNENRDVHWTNKCGTFPQIWGEKNVQNI